LPPSASTCFAMAHIKIGNMLPAIFLPLIYFMAIQLF
jgi:uncharacterized membrane protein YqgA involved in biofilm formation